MAMYQAIRKRSNMQLLAVAMVFASLAVIEPAYGAKVDLMQYHHYKSPYATPNLSLTDRVLIAVKSSRERAQSLRKTKTSNSSVPTEPVFSEQGSYIMEVQLGTPPQTKLAIADTGSDLFWLQCECSDDSCFPEPDPIFDPTKSSTYSLSNCSDPICIALPQISCGTNNECDYVYEYADSSSTQGVLAKDVLTLGSEAFSVEFGCGQQNQGDFNDTDGLVGLGRGPASIIKQIGSNFENMFSYCLVSFYDSQNQTSPLVFGPDSPGNRPNYSYTPLLTGDTAGNTVTFYYLNLTGISVNGKPLAIPPGTFTDTGFILDSGTTLSYLQSAGYDPLLNELEELITYQKVDGTIYGLDLCYAPAVSTPTWPKVIFHFEGLDIALPDDNVFLVVDAGIYCLFMGSLGDDFGIYGNVQQQNFVLQYNVGKSVLGISGPTTCTSYV